MRRADIPPDVLARMTRGEEPTRTLVEFLAVDLAQLAEHVARAQKLPRLLAVAETARARAADGIMDRMRACGAALQREIGIDGRAFARLAAHGSDLVREWCAFAVGFQPGLALDERLARIRPFAADAHMGVRECAWFAARAHLAADLHAAIALLRPWVQDDDANVRRFAVEATRPRGVWCTHIEALKRDPSPGLPLLEAVRSDPAKYVRDSAGNWLNDAAKSRPDWVRSLCRRWERESPTPETAYVCRRALRSLG